MKPEVLDVTLDEIEIGDLLTEGHQVVMISAYQVWAAVRYTDRAPTPTWGDPIKITLAEGEKVRVIRGVAVASPLYPGKAGT